ncbi:MAG: enoyl-CoA hydratase/isomerase family protein [Rhizobium sp.]|nr:enoyl-CoA hydratase/isomerase family protein [Rhizobium sp.]
MASEIAVSAADGVMEVRFARPAKLNAVTAEMYGAIAEAIHEFNRTNALRTIVFTGEGAHYCAGNDLAEFLTIYSLTGGSPWRQFLEALAGIRKPVIAAVQGRAVGIGMTMLLHCDVVYVEPDARLSAPFVNLGLSPEAGSSLLLPARVGHLRAMEIFALGRELDAETALAWNLATAVTAPGRARSTALETASRLAGLNAEALMQTKRLTVGDIVDIRAQIKAECEAFIGLLSTEETRHGLAALLEVRRKPRT